MIRILITDLDNTLYDWVDYYIPCFNAMVAELSRITSLEEKTLLQSFKRVHQRHHTSEYAFAIEELDVLADINAGLTVRQRLQKYASAIDAFRDTRRKTLRLYDGVHETLQEMKSEGLLLVAYSDAGLFYATQRLRRLGIESLFDGIVSPRDHGLPQGLRPEDVRFYRDSRDYESSIKFQLELGSRAWKPDPESLNQILRHFEAKASETVYVGDSLNKDIFMAQKCGVHDVYAEYGRQYDLDNYRRLVEITHWTEEDVAREAELAKNKIEPTYRIQSFPEIRDVVNIIRMKRCNTSPEIPLNLN